MMEALVGSSCFTSWERRRLAATEEASGTGIARTALLIVSDLGGVHAWAIFSSSSENEFVAPVNQRRKAAQLGGSGGSDRL